MNAETKLTVMKIWTTIKALKREMLTIQSKNNDLEKRINDLEDTSSYESDDSFYDQKRISKDVSKSFDTLNGEYK